MSDKLKALEDELEKLVEASYARFEDIEKAFSLGMQISNEISVLGIKNYEVASLVKKRNEEERKQKFNAAIEKINKFLEKLIRASVKETIRESGNWTVEKMDYLRSSYVDKFSDETVNKFNIQYVRADMQSYGGDFDLDFVIVGDLEKLLRKYDLFGELNATLTNNDGEESTRLYDDEDVRYIRRTHLDTLYRLRDADIEKIEEIQNEIEKLYTFKLLASNS